jgi:hypothetical protein
MSEIRKSYFYLLTRAKYVCVNMLTTHYAQEKHVNNTVNTGVKTTLEAADEHTFNVGSSS